MSTKYYVFHYTGYERLEDKDVFEVSLIGKIPKPSEIANKYKIAAIVMAQSLDDVFRITNHIDSDWTNNPEVFRTAKAQHRSTSVSDLIYDDAGRTWFVVMAEGFKKLEKEPEVINSFFYFD